MGKKAKAKKEPEIRENVNLTDALAHLQPHSTQLDLAGSPTGKTKVIVAERKKKTGIVVPDEEENKRPSKKEKAKAAQERKKGEAKAQRMQEVAEEDEDQQQVSPAEQHQGGCCGGVEWNNGDNEESSAASGSSPLMNYCSIAMVVLSLVLLFALRIGEEGYQMGNVSRAEVSHYDTLDVPGNADLADIKSAYKKLAMRWHPDKNKNCEECETKFHAIARAYETLSDFEKRNIYDKSAGDFDSISCSACTRITDKNYESLVKNSNDVWVIQVYSDVDSSCQHFGPHWDRAAIELGKYAKFGRIDALRDSAALSLFPIKIRVKPTVVMLVRGVEPYIFPLGDMSYRVLKKWFFEHFPQNVPTRTTEWLSGPRPKILVVSNKAPATLLRSCAYRWDSVFEFGTMVPSKAPKSIKAKKDTALALFGPFVPEPVSVQKVKGNELHATLYEMQTKFVPYVDRRNLDLLCKSNNIHRIFCLVVVDLPTNGGVKSVSAIREKLEAQRPEKMEDPFVVQMVRISTEPQSVMDANPIP